MSWNTVVVDEAHRLKNTESQLHEIVRNVRVECLHLLFCCSTHRIDKTLIRSTIDWHAGAEQYT
jgi:hypothetical protein